MRGSGEYCVPCRSKTLKCSKKLSPRCHDLSCQLLSAYITNNISPRRPTIWARFKCNAWNWVLRISWSGHNLCVILVRWRKKAHDYTCVHDTKIARLGTPYCWALWEQYSCYAVCMLAFEISSAARFGAWTQAYSPPFQCMAYAHYGGMYMLHSYNWLHASCTGLWIVGGSVATNCISTLSVMRDGHNR